MYKRIARSILVPLCAVSSIAFAASQGTLASTAEGGSSGSIAVEFSVADKIKIYNLRDVTMSLAKNRENGEIVSSLSTFSVYRNQKGDDYNITFTSANLSADGQSGFYLSGTGTSIDADDGADPDTTLLPYTIELFDNANGDGDPVNVKHGAKASALQSTVQTSSGQEVSTSMKLTVNNASNLASGTFTDTLTMVVSTE